MSELDRTSPVYVERALEEAWEVDPDALIHGVRAPRPPESYTELQAYVDSKRDLGCPVSEEIDSFMKIVAADPNPDEIARRLPYDEDGMIVFVLPKF